MMLYAKALTLWAAIVPLAYLVFGKALAAPVKENPVLLAKLVGWASKLHLQAKTDKNTYVEADDKPGQFEEGSKFPVYACVQLAILASIIALVRRYHGNWKALLSTVLVFFLTAFPNEAYSIHQGYWLYNSQKMIGIFFLHIPLEGWLMYFLPAVLACFMLDVANRMFFGKDV